jgi:pseudaminic acid synthase
MFVATDVFCLSRVPARTWMVAPHQECVRIFQGGSSLSYFHVALKYTFDMAENGKDVLFIAEVSANHLGSFERAKQIVVAAAKAGASAIKFQTYTADTMTLDIDEFKVSDGHELWGGRRLHSLYQEAHTPWEWHPELFKLCRSLHVLPFSSPFDLSAIELLESLDAPMYKIASLETGDHRLIRAVAETGKPLIISTGATEWTEIEEVVEVVQESGNKDLTLLVCTSSYPSDPLDAHLNRITTLRNHFGVKVGLSDHTLGIGVSIAAIGLGATAIEKHITLARTDGGADGAFSMEPSEFALLVKEGTSAFQALGEPQWSMQDSEKESRRLRRSLYVVKDVKAGDIVTIENVRAIRPGDGCPPKLLEQMLGRHFSGDFVAGTPMSPELLRMFV